MGINNPLKSKKDSNNLGIKIQAVNTKALNKA